MEKSKICTLILSTICVLAVSSCVEKRKFQIRQDCYSAIQDYVAEHESYNSFLLLSTKKLFNGNVFYQVFLIGPLYEGLDVELKDFRAIELCEFKKKKIFVFSEISYIIKDNENYKAACCKRDSILDLSFYGEHKYTYSSLINYLKRGRLLYYRDGKLHVLNNPDRLYLPTIKIDSMRP